MGLIQGVHIRRRQERKERGQRDGVEGTSHHEVIIPVTGSSPAKKAHGLMVGTFIRTWLGTSTSTPTRQPGEPIRSQH